MKDPNILRNLDMQKGHLKGEIIVEPTLNPYRDAGRLVKFVYSDIGDNPTVKTEIRVRREDLTDEQAIERWCLKFKKKSWKLL